MGRCWIQADLPHKYGRLTRVVNLPFSLSTATRARFARLRRAPCALPLCFCFCFRFRFRFVSFFVVWHDVPARPQPVRTTSVGDRMFVFSLSPNIARSAILACPRRSVSRISPGNSSCFCLPSLAVAWLLFEYCITLDQEIDLFWGQKITGASVLFLSNRYLPLFCSLWWVPWWRQSLSFNVSRSLSRRICNVCLLTSRVRVRGMFADTIHATRTHLHRALPGVCSRRFLEVSWSTRPTSLLPVRSSHLSSKRLRLIRAAIGYVGQPSRRCEFML